MPTPLAHALAGMAIAWSAESIRRTPLGSGARVPLAVTCGALAMFPDLDLMYPPVHRMMTHSAAAVVLAGISAGFIMRRSSRDAAWAVPIVCGLAYASHLALDWIGGDTKLPAGIQLLWPFHDTWFISSWGVFRATDLGGFFTVPVMVSNSMAVLRELLILGPIGVGAWFFRRRRLLVARSGRSCARRASRGKRQQEYGRDAIRRTG